jgi:aryl sulfotransferase
MAELLCAPARVVQTPVADSRRWNRFEPRDGDIVIATFAKCGTTWTQRIVDLLVFQSQDVRPFGEISPWLDSTIFNPLEDDLATLRAQTHRRYIKSHLPFDALPLWDTVKYIHVGRDGRDARLSWQNHQQGFTPAITARIAAQAMALAAERGAGLTGPPPPAPDDPRAYLIQWFEELEAALDAPGGGGSTSFGFEFFGFEATYWRERRRPNLLLVHYNDLKEDLAGEMQRIADFLGIATPEALMPSLVEAARFETMKRDGDALFPRLKEAFDRGADRFINQGRSGRWRECLDEEDIARYEAIMRRASTPGLAHWLEGGRRIAGDPASSRD